MSTQQATASLKDALLPEYDQEMATTRKHLERVPNDKLAWTPHEKSMTLGKLASHIAETASWATSLLNDDVLDFDSPEAEEYTPADFDSRDAILEAFDKNVAMARDLISSKSDAELMSTWAAKKGGEVIMAMPKIAAAKGFLVNHVIHHRGQLSVYLRMCGVPVPQTYGPTADETEF